MTNFKNHMNKKLRNMLAFTAGFMIVFAIGYTFYSNVQLPEQNTNADVMDIREHAPNSPEGVYEKHKNECWTMDQAPKAELPGAAIVQFNDGTAIYTKKPSLVDAAFNEALAAVGFGDVISDKIDVIALCK